MSTPTLRPNIRHEPIRTPLARSPPAWARPRKAPIISGSSASRLSPTCLLDLVSGLIIVVQLAGADHATVKAALGQSARRHPSCCADLSGIMHMRLGMQTIIEDYVHGEGRKIACSC